MPTPAAVMKRRLRDLEARAAELHERIAVLQREADQVEAQVTRWRIGGEIFEEVEQELREGGAGDRADGAAGVPAAADAGEAAESSHGVPGAGSGSRYVPQWSEGADPARLPGLYSEIVSFVSSADGPVRVPDVVRALFGEGAGRSRQEGVRAQLKRLVERYWLVSEDGRSFTAGSR
ncbi:hypothetical protein GCM10027073_74400 [Streptomyces chlorus]|uniref:Uncharacterized protein n=1 Tax=Streptomyces chlorus TaxID=887452 RepID=A0ABW1EBP7_9ACTN